MDFIMEWVTQIIIFVLLASIIDLLVPTSAMKKYIKLVVGLILLLILLKPVFYIFQVDIQHEVETALSAITSSTGNEDSVENLADFQKTEIEERQDAYILEQMAVQLIEIAKDPLYGEYQIEITSIDFRFSEEALSRELSFESLDMVIVYVKQAKDGEGAVNAVDDVVIDTDDPLAKDEIEDVEGIELLLREVWELDNKELIIVEEGGAS
jgi:stage III sporulation protein AF